MKKKICLWINNNFGLLAVAKYLQNHEDYELYAIIDSSTGIEEVIKNQKLVKFKKIWYFKGEYQSCSIIDFDYMKSIEKKSNITFSFIASIERLFYKKFNQYHDFTQSEILSILEQETRFFESILLEKKFDIVLCSPIVRHFQYLFYSLCKNRKILFLMFESVRFGNRYIVSDAPYFEIAKKIQENSVVSKKLNSEEIKKFLDTFKPRKFLADSKLSDKYKISKGKKLKALVQFPFIKNDNEEKFSTFGRTKKNILLKGLGRLQLRRQKKREQYMDSKFLKKINKDDNYVYFPLHVEPEKALHLGAPFYTDQIAVIQNIAKFLPVEYKLFVKEHPGMKMRGWREISFYEKIKEIPNVILVHPSIKTKEIIENSSLVITIRGTSGIESVFYEKPSIVLVADYGYPLIPSIKVLEKIDELPHAIKDSLKKNVKIYDLMNYINFIEENTVELDFTHYTYDVAYAFNYNIGYMEKPKFEISELENLFHKFDNMFKILSKEFVFKINQHQKNNNSRNCQT